MHRGLFIISAFFILAFVVTAGCESETRPSSSSGATNSGQEDQNIDVDDGSGDGSGDPGQSTDDVIVDPGDDSENDGPVASDQDNDGDGFSPAEGDCRDFGEGSEFINPNAKEDPDDGVDNDCDGEVDEVETCDCPSLETDGIDLANAMELCDPRFVLSADMDKTSPNGQVGWDTLPSMGNNNCLVAQAGCEMAVISTGKVGQPNPNNGGGMGLYVSENKSVDPQPDFQGDQQTTAEIQPSCDRTQLRLRLKAPSNAMGFSFDFLFGSAEYPEWINQNYNDTFYAIMEYAQLNNGRTTNISFDSNGNEIEVDSNFFENNQFACDEAGSGWGTLAPSGSGTTGWLRTSWSVEPGAEFTLTFSIHDEGDCLYDSITFLDNWQWHTEEVEAGTEPVVI